MASCKILKTKGSIPSKYVSRKKLKSRQGVFGYHHNNNLAFVPGDPEFKIEDFMVYSEPVSDIENLPCNLHEPDISFIKDNAALSFNFTDYVINREHGFARRQSHSINKEYGTRHLLTTGMYKEKTINLDRINKVFCSQWLNEHQIVMGTRCNKLLIYDVNNHNIDVIPSLIGTETSTNNRNDHQSAIHATQINPSRTILATGAQNSKEIAAYKLPTLDPICVGEKAHSEWILDLCWLDDQFLVSGSTDGKLALWKINENLMNIMEPRYSKIKCRKVQKCFGADKIRALCFNSAMNEIVALSMNAYIHVWDSNRFWQKMSRKLPHAVDNACLTMREDGSLYAIGSKSHFTLLDPRTLHHVKKVNARVSGCSVRSISFHKDILTIGTGIGIVMLYDMRAGKYMESTMNSGRAVVLKSSKGWINPDDAYHDLIRNIEHTPAIFTHCYDWSGTRLFTAGGPLDEQLQGNYAAVWC